MMPLAVPRLPAVGTEPICGHAVGGLLLDDDPLDFSQNGFAFGQTQTQRFRLEFRPLQRGDLVYLLLTIVGQIIGLTPPALGAIGKSLSNVEVEPYPSVPNGFPRNRMLSFFSPDQP